MLELTVGGETSRLSEDDLDEAMKQYWDAKSSGDTSAALVKVHVTDPNNLAEMPTREAMLTRVPSANGSPVERPAPERPSTPGGHLSLVAKARIERQDRVLSENGFALPPPVFAPGTRVLPVGDENFRIERQQMALLPTFVDASAALLLQVGDEEREDRSVKLKDLALDDEGGLVVGSDRLLLEEEAFFQLCSLGGFGIGARYLAELCRPPLRAQNVNAQLKDRRSREVVLRTRLARDGRRSVFAAVSPSYAAVDGPDALREVLPALFDARCEVVYDGRSTVATSLWMPDQVVDLAAGDVFKAGVRITCEDTGRGRIRVTAVVWRNLCLNLLIVAEGEAEVGSVVHRGVPEAILWRLPKMVEEARTKVAAFLDEWGHARSLKLDVPETLKQWVEDKRVVVRGERKESLVEALVAAWQKEPGGTLADAVNAVTRAAHEVPRFDHAIRLDLERQAGQLVVARR